MANELGEAVLTLRTDSSDFEAGISRAESAFTPLQAKILSWNAALDLLGKGWSAISGAVDTFIGSAEESENQIAKLNAAIESTHRFTQADSEGFQQLASDLQKVTTSSDEAITSAERLAISMGAQTSGQVERLTKAALDLSAGIGIDLDGAMMALGKALQGNATMFERWGFTVSQSGTASQKLDSILQQIQDRFGGQAAAEGKTFSGAVTRAKNALDDFYEEMGKLITESPLVKSMIDGIITGFQNASTWVNQNRDAFRGLAEQGIRYVQAVLSELLGYLQQLTNFTGLKTISDAFKVASSWAGDLENKAKEAVAQVGEITKTITATGTAFSNTADATAKLSTNLENTTKGSGAFKDNWGSALDGVVQKVQENGKEFIKLTETVKDNPLAPQVETDKPKAVLAGLGSWFVTQANSIGNAMGKAIVDGVVAGLSTIPSRVAGAISSAISGARAYAAGPSGAALGGGSPTYGAPTGGGGSSGISIPASVDVSNAQQTITALSDQMHSAGLDIPFEVTLTGSPTLPFSQYLNDYAPGVIGKMTSNLPSLNFSTNLSSIIAESADWSRKFGDSLLPSGAFDILSQGTKADPAQIREAINQALEMQRYFQWADQTDSHLMPLVSSVPNGGTPYPTPGDQARAFQGIAAQLQSLLGAVTAGNTTVQATDTRMAAAAERTASASERMVSQLDQTNEGLRSGRFLSNITLVNNQINSSTTGARYF